MTYIGMTDNLKKRIKQHNNGESNFTKKYIPWILIYFEAYKNQKDAVLRERKLKKYGSALGGVKKRIVNSFCIIIGLSTSFLELCEDFS